MCSQTCTVRQQVLRPYGAGPAGGRAILQQRRHDAHELVKAHARVIVGIHLARGQMSVVQPAAVAPCTLSSWLRMACICPASFRASLNSHGRTFTARPRSHHKAQYVFQQPISLYVYLGVSTCCCQEEGAGERTKKCTWRAIPPGA